MVTELVYKITWVILIYFLMLGQYKVWFTDESIVSYWHLQDKIENQVSINLTKNEVNKTLFAELASLRGDYLAIEERARNDLGLIKPGEKYFQIID